MTATDWIALGWALAACVVFVWVLWLVWDDACTMSFDRQPNVSSPVCVGRRRMERPLTFTSRGRGPDGAGAVSAHVPIAIPWRLGFPPGVRAYRYGECSVFVGRETSRAGRPSDWHLSIAHPSRYPTWDEIHGARYALVPDAVTMAMILPPRAQYVNYHPNCFHLWEIAGEEAPGASTAAGAGGRP